MTHPARTINTMSVETPAGFRTFNLVFGDITSSQDPLVIASSWRVFENIGGQVISAFERQGVKFDQLSPIINLGNGIATFSVDVNDSIHPWRLLVVGLPGAEGRAEVTDQLEKDFKSGIWSLFGSLAALELRGECFNAISLPMLGGNREYSPEFVVSTLLDHAVEWLKTSRSMRTINAWVHEEEMAQVWIEAMDTVLHRRTVSSTADSVTQALIDEILSHLVNSRSLQLLPFEAPSRGIALELGSGEVSIQRLATFSRVLVEQMVKKMVTRYGLSWKGNLWEGITSLARANIVAPWIISHFHTLRVLGNESVHGLAEAEYVPTDLQDSDLVPVLACLGRVLDFWQSLDGNDESINPHPCST